MANCHLNIQVDDPDRIYHGGETITGVVRVQTTAEVRCKKLEVSIGWRTHGKGNVAKATTQTVEVFSGTWEANQSYSYHFSLSVVGWPPSYSGHFLNIDRVIDARADVPWSFDVKTSEVFRVVPLTLDAEAIAQTNKSTQSSAAVAAVILTMVVLVMGGVMVAFAMTAPFMLLFSIPLGLVLIGFAIVRGVLPKWRLGRVQCDWPVTDVHPGQSIRGTLVIEPKKIVPIDGIEVVLKGIEKCVSGSGSNQTTHQHTVFENTFLVSPPTSLQPQRENKFDLMVTVPDDAPLSVSLLQNELIWSIVTRVIQNRWPDWVGNQKMTVSPHANGSPTAFSSAATETYATTEQSQISFEETVCLISDSIDQPDQRDLIVEATSGISMQATIDLDRRLLYAGEDGPKVNRGEILWWATASQTEPPLPLLIIVAESTAKSWQDRDLEGVQGQLEILKYDTRHDRLQVRWIS